VRGAVWRQTGGFNSTATYRLQGQPLLRSRLRNHRLPLLPGLLRGRGGTQGAPLPICTHLGTLSLTFYSLPPSHLSPVRAPQPAAAPQTPPPRARDAPPLPVALDCEMAAVLCADGRVRDAAVRVCVVDEAERVLLHSLISPAGPVVDYRTEYTGAVSGVSIAAHSRAHAGLVAGDLDGAPSLDVVRARVVSILSGCEGEGLSPEETASQPVPRLLVGHGLENDLAVLHLSHPASLLRDTALHAPLQRATTGKAHKLRDLVALHLGYAIQAAGAAHDPEEDAVGAMRLYRRVKCLARRHQEQAARDNAALLRAQGGGGYAAAARGGSSDAPAPAEAALWEAATCWCLDPPGVDAVKGCH